MPEKYQENLQKAIKELQLADHMAYVTYPIVKDKRILLKILAQVCSSLTKTITSILQKDYLWKRIRLYKDPKSNFQVFREKCAPRYNITEQEISEIISILSILEKHKKSPLEFERRDKIIIMSDNLKTKIIDLETIKNSIMLTKKILKSVINTDDKLI